MPSPGSRRWTSRRAASAGPRSSCSPELRGTPSSRSHGVPCAWQTMRAEKAPRRIAPAWRGRMRRRPALRRATLDLAVFRGGAPRSIRGTTSCPRDDAPSRSFWAFVFPGESGSAASIAPMRPAATSGRLPPVTAVLLCGLVFCTWTAGAGLPVLILLGFLGLAPASEIAVSLVHRLVTLLVSPRLHPKLELSQGVPPQLATMIVVPTLLTSLADIEEQVERLEVHYLANSEGHLRPCPPSDWTDGRHEHMPRTKSPRCPARRYRAPQ